MHKPVPTQTAPKAWTAPRLEKLGTISDVAGTNRGNRQFFFNFQILS